MLHHVWVESGTQMPATPGLLCEWRRTATGGYEGRVVMLAGTIHEPGQAISISMDTGGTPAACRAIGAAGKRLTGTSHVITGIEARNL